MDKKTKALKSESKNLSPTIIIGKNGLTDQVVANIREEITKTHLIKIKILPTYIEDKDKKQVALDMAERCNAKLIDLVGFTVVLGRK